MDNNETFRERLLRMKRYNGYIIDISHDHAEEVAETDADTKKNKERQKKNIYRRLSVRLSVSIRLSVLHLPPPQDSWKMAFSWAFISRSWCECPSKPIIPSTCSSPQRGLGPPPPYMAACPPAPPPP